MKYILRTMCVLAVYVNHAHAMGPTLVELHSAILAELDNDYYQIVKSSRNHDGAPATQELARVRFSLEVLGTAISNLQSESDSDNRQRLAKKIALLSISDDALKALHENPSNHPALTITPSLKNEIYPHTRHAYAMRQIIPHDKHIDAAVLSPNDALIATISNNHNGTCGYLRIFKTATGEEMRTMCYQYDGQNLWYGPRAVAFHPDNTNVMIIDSEDSAALVDAESGVKRTLDYLQNVDKVAFSPDSSTIAAALRDGSVSLHSLTNTALAHASQITHQGAVKSVAFSANGKLLATASNDTTAKVLDLEHNTSFEVQHDECVNSAALSSDNTMLATASDDCSVKVFDLNTHELILHIKLATAARGVAFVPHKRELLIQSDKTIKVCDIDTGVRRYQVKHNLFLHTAAISTDGSTIVTASHHGNGNVVDTQSGNILHRITYRGWFKVAAVSQTGDTIITAPGMYTGPLTITERLTRLANTFDQALLKKYLDWCKQSGAEPNQSVKTALE